MAVPGSGKTASVTERTKRLIQRGIEPRRIMAITFTNKAATEMKQRIGTAVGPDVASKMTISTFHSLCSRIIRANCELLGLTKSYSIYDTDDQERLLKTCIKKIEEIGSAKWKPSKQYMSSLMGFIEGKRNGCLSDEIAVGKYNLDGNQARVSAEYFKQLQQSNAVDFTGLLSETLRLFQEHPEIRDVYRGRFKFISIDEVQDTNIAQYELIKHLGQGHKNVLMVGDLDQSIYKFRDANPENIFQFEKDFPGAIILKLETNYRSTPSILKYSQNLIEHNLMRKGTSLKTENPDGNPPVIVAGENDLEMARLIAEDVNRKIAAGIKPKEIVILYRTNYASRVIENAMRDYRIKYRIIGGLSFWDRKEVKAGLSLLKVLANENDRMAFEKVVEACSRGVGDKALANISDIAQKQSLTILQAARQFSIGEAAANKCLRPLMSALDECSGLLPGQSLIKIAHATSFWDRLEADSTDTNDRCQNIMEMASDVDDYCARKNSSLSGYLQNISLLTDADEDKDDDHLVKMMTLHACKGLEFDVVYISHCNAGILPHARIAIECGDDEEKYKRAVEEERRLLYVGMTRARKHLALFFATSKIDARSRKTEMMMPSPFLFETGIASKYLSQYQIDDQALLEN